MISYYNYQIICEICPPKWIFVLVIDKNPFSAEISVHTISHAQGESPYSYSPFNRLSKVTGSTSLYHSSCQCTTSCSWWAPGAWGAHMSTRCTVSRAPLVCLPPAGGAWPCPLPCPQHHSLLPLGDHASIFAAGGLNSADLVSSCVGQKVPKTADLVLL